MLQSLNGTYEFLSCVLRLNNSANYTQNNDVLCEYCRKNYAYFIIAFSLSVFVYRNVNWRRLRMKYLGGHKGPYPFPFLGNLVYVSFHSSPFEAFSKYSQKYGDIFEIYLGTQKCVVVNKMDAIKDVLIKKGTQFGGRPDFLRYHAIFGGDRQNSLALCDWSNLQKTRRHIARSYCTPRVSSPNYKTLAMVSERECEHMLFMLDRTLSKYKHGIVDLKSILLRACGNIFFEYMCSKRFSYDNESFRKMVRNYDQIFYDINQGYAMDIFPSTSVFWPNKLHLRRLSSWSQEIRQFILENIVNKRIDHVNITTTPRDFLDGLLIKLHTDPTLTKDHILFELEDFLGGHSAVANLTQLCVIYLIKHPNVLRSVREEILSITDGTREVTLSDKPRMPYTEAMIYETLRVTSSPIVPHVATEDSDILGFPVAKGTCVFVNNFGLNKSPDFWENPDDFEPLRFVRDGGIVKPAHFIPFGTGKRTCIGQQLVNGCTFLLVANLVQKYNFNVLHKSHTILKQATVALPVDAYPIRLSKVESYY